MLLGRAGARLCASVPSYPTALGLSRLTHKLGL